MLLPLGWGFASVRASLFPRGRRPARGGGGALPGGAHAAAGDRHPLSPRTPASEARASQTEWGPAESKLGWAEGEPALGPSGSELSAWHYCAYITRAVGPRPESARTPLETYAAELIRKGSVGWIWGAPRAA